MANAVATKKKQEVAPADLMSMFEEQSGAGLENLTQDDLALPFIKILCFSEALYPVGSAGPRLRRTP